MSEQKRYTLVGLFLDHPSAVAETFVLQYEAERPQGYPAPKIEDPEDARPWVVVAVFEGHLTPAYIEKLV